jgi:hypothetical protein
MNEKMVKLLDWYLAIYNEKYVLAWGHAINHPRLPDGMHIHTSWIEKIKVNKAQKVVDILTHSQNHYQLQFRDICIQDDECLFKTKEALNKLGIDSSFVDAIKTGVVDSRVKDLQEIDAALENGDLYLRFIGNVTARAVFKEDDKVYDIQGYTHTGMFQDSVLLHDLKHVDYRYFPMGYNCIKTYHRSDGIERFIVKNIGASWINFDGKRIDPGNELVISVNEHNYIEGLLSPDFVNGKSAFRDINNEDREPISDEGDVD